MCPVINNVLNFVYFLNKTKIMFTINPINNTIIVLSTKLCFFNPSVTACNPKYGSITAASKLNFVFNAAKIGLNVTTNPAAPTFNIMYPTVPFINPPTASYIFSPKNKYPTNTNNPTKNCGFVKILLAKNVPIV